MKHMHVVIGIVINVEQKVLIAQRPPGTYQSGRWEFPGGKIELGENAFQALQRELSEEVGIRALAAECWLRTGYEYPDRQVMLETWIVRQFKGEPYGAEGQAVRWVTVTELADYTFPEGNQIVLEKLIYLLQM